MSAPGDVDRGNRVKIRILVINYSQDRTQKTEVKVMTMIMVDYEILPLNTTILYNVH